MPLKNPVVRPRRGNSRFFFFPPIDVRSDDVPEKTDERIFGCSGGGGGGGGGGGWPPLGVPRLRNGRGARDSRQMRPTGGPEWNQNPRRVRYALPVHALVASSG